MRCAALMLLLLAGCSSPGKHLSHELTIPAPVALRFAGVAPTADDAQLPPITSKTDYEVHWYDSDVTFALDRKDGDQPSFTFDMHSVANSANALEARKADDLLTDKIQAMVGQILAQALSQAAERDEGLTQAYIAQLEKRIKELESKHP